KAAPAIVFELLITVQLSAQSTYDSVRQAVREPGSWLTYHGTYDAQRFSGLDEINSKNVQQLRPVWMYQVQGRHHFETTPLVFDGVMYLTDPPSDVVALDVKTGRPLWAYRRTLPEDLRACCGNVNRGVAALGDQIFVATIDAHLVALDMKTGRVRWDMEIADYKTGHSLTAAPLAVNVDSGALRWHFQFTPHDVNDIDATEIPILIDADFRGRPRKLLLFANRNGFFYIFDRVTGEYLHARAFARQTWTKGLDEKGR